MLQCFGHLPMLRLHPRWSAAAHHLAALLNTAHGVARFGQSASTACREKQEHCADEGTHRKQRLNVRLRQRDCVRERRERSFGVNARSRASYALTVR